MKAAVLVMCILACWVIPPPFSIDRSIRPKYTAPCHGVPWPIAPLSAEIAKLKAKVRSGSTTTATQFRKIVYSCVRPGGYVVMLATNQNV